MYKQSGPLRRTINQDYLLAEKVAIARLVDSLSDYEPATIRAKAFALVSAIRKEQQNQSLVESFLHEYELNSEEGIILMGIAEALLRIPDGKTQDVFLQEKLSEADWYKHLDHSESLLVNFSTRALSLTGKFERQFNFSTSSSRETFSHLLARLGQPLIRRALQQAMQQLAYQFVIAETIEQAYKQSRQHAPYLYSFDMLGEAALTENDAERYFSAYSKAISCLGQQANHSDPLQNPGISIKLSALYPRYEPLQRRSAVETICRQLSILVHAACEANITVTIDAEESERLDMSLEIFQKVFMAMENSSWQGFGLAVQAYQKRALAVLHWLIELAKVKACKIPVRLVKGAYWDSEIKKAQSNGLSDYPVFTHKSATDLSYLACARLMLAHSKCIYPQFASHNAHSVTAIMELGRQHPGYEFQRLHGMGEALYRQLIKQTQGAIPCRIYAPVGSYRDLLPYLVRRLLENGANTSFINLLENPDVDIETVIADPVTYFRQKPELKTHCVLPRALYGERLNSEGLNLADDWVLKDLQLQMHSFVNHRWEAAPLINGEPRQGKIQAVSNPADAGKIVGSLVQTKADDFVLALDSAVDAFQAWRLSPVKQRAECLLKYADLLQQNRTELVALCVHEAGKTIKDALAEIREAVDFCRYYAQSAIELQSNPQTLPGPTGETNQLYLYGRGVFVCISPWNFPVAIFTGQIVAALVSGNCVLAKPAMQTVLLAMRCIQLLHQAGVPKQVLHFLPAEGSAVSRYLLTDSRIAGVAFTGSLATAKKIERQLNTFPGIVPLIAETGGQNVMFADSSAYSEQLLQDVLQSAFNSAGQRCSALRVLYLPHASADRVINSLIDAMRLLRLGDPRDYATDIGPLITEMAAKELTEHVEAMRREAKVLFTMEIAKTLTSSCFFPPTVIELSSLQQLKQENFGPILHIIRYDPEQLEDIIGQINASGYGLTLGVHSRIHKTIDTIVQNCRVGNVYVNRNMIAAIVGSQPFGGMGLSGTGPKAGGPYYLQRFCNEQTVSINTTAVGGNTGLLAQDLR